jgi:hypothetical protein
MDVTIKITGIEGLVDALNRLVGVIPMQQAPTQLPQQPTPVQQQVPTWVPQVQPDSIDQFIGQVVPTGMQPTAVPPGMPNPQIAAPTPTAVPVTPKLYTLDELRTACAPLMDAGRQNNLAQLINSFGVPSLVALPTEMYGAFATAIRQMGAKI